MNGVVTLLTFNVCAYPWGSPSVSGCTKLSAVDFINSL